MWKHPFTLPDSQNPKLVTDNIIESLDNNIKSLTAELAKLKDDLSPVWALVKEYKVRHEMNLLKVAV